MQLPKQVKKEKNRKLKLCHEPGCGKEFWSSTPTAKYCDIHRDIRFRVRKKRVFEDVTVRNQIFIHNFSHVTAIEFTCQLRGCTQNYTVQVFPRQTTYPKYCDEHRNEFKRELFLRKKKGKQCLINC